MLLNPFVSSTFRISHGDRRISLPFLSPTSQRELPFYPSRKPSPACCLSVERPNDQSPAAAANGGNLGLRVVVAAGGTAGHISPAMAIGDELKSADPPTRILFVGCPNSMESTTVPAAGFDFAAISAGKLSRPFLYLTNLFGLPLNLLRSARESYAILRDFEPQIVVGTGGHVSFPTCLAAVVLGIKLVIQEQNSVPGIANWVLSFFADKIFTAFNSAVNSFPKRSAAKCVVCGNPIRQALRRYISKAAARVNYFGQWAGAMAEAKVVLVLSGSLGANSVNIALLNCYSQVLSEHENWFFIWQTGVEAFDEMDSLVRSHPRLFLAPFLKSIDMAYAASDLVVSRAGAMTCSEILALGKPSILIPSPKNEEGHQLRNASLMADIVGAKVISEEELDSIALRTAMEEVLGDEERMAEMSERALKAAKPDAASVIAQHILSLVKS
ncbi:PREDICTED: uncharacterized protein LOC104813907 [Tarenaya hassleriana]|uniref:uncharacterized protein LOC104813907 n=1 Tax=Tarenaya hassleriana TaxID=28532 RepID=UPI00053C0B24|nr:PREDICTED: uncharacterized protein LOC104813907 [Tarenaya hassleriana]XP_019058100.1 PREDICTED: uncharacterized protein LOC104813907 [Tarenaya hassleriana]